MIKRHVAILISMMLIAGLSYGSIIYVDDDNTTGPWDGTQEHPYQKIQDGIGAVVSGDTVFVMEGTYYEHVVINKSLTLEGENRETTIIDGSGTGDLIHLYADNVRIKKIKATNGRYGIFLDDVGIGNALISDCIVTLNSDEGIHGRYIESNIIIEDCELSWNGGAGIWLHHVDNSIIRRCQSFRNGYDTTQPHRFGIDIAWCSNSSIVECDVYEHSGSHAIVLDSTSGCIVEGCHVWDNENDGIRVYSWGSSVGNIVRGNIVENNASGIILVGGQGAPRNSQVYHNHIISNVVQAQDAGSTNRWDNGYPSGGNYWSDYTGTDLYSGPNQDQPSSDGIGDTPYWINANVKDNYPMYKLSAVIVEIDIKPGSGTNPINLKSNGVIPVAILTTSTESGEDVDFDATSVDPLTVKFGPGEAAPVHGGGHIEDVDGDDDLDMVLHFNTQETGIGADDIEVVLKGMANIGGNATSIQGSDSIKVVGAKAAPSLNPGRKMMNTWSSIKSK